MVGKRGHQERTATPDAVREGYPDALIDLETLGTSRAPVITAIGAVVFDRDAEEFEGRGFWWRVDIDSCLAAGLRVDGSTVEWWLDPARSHAWERIRTRPALPLGYVLSALRGFLGANWAGERVWSHGAAFDLAILEHVYGLVREPRPWSTYRCLRDTRTYFEARGYVAGATADDTAHHPLLDADRQARWVWEAARQRV